MSHFLGTLPSQRLRWLRLLFDGVAVRANLDARVTRWSRVRWNLFTAPHIIKHGNRSGGCDCGGDRRRGTVVVMGHTSGWDSLNVLALVVLFVILFLLFFLLILLRVVNRICI